MLFNELEAHLLQFGFFNVNKERNYHGREITYLRNPRGRAGHLQTDRKNVDGAMQPEQSSARLISFQFIFRKCK